MDDGLARIVYGGQFTCDDEDNVYGRLDEVAIGYDGQVVAAADNLNFSASAAQSFIDDDNVEGLFIQTFSGADTFYGSAGADGIFTYAGGDRVEAGDGADVISSGEENDTVLGGVGSDIVYGGFGDDLLFGGQGDGADRPSATSSSLFGIDGPDQKQSDKRNGRKRVIYDRDGWRDCRRDFNPKDEQKHEFCCLQPAKNDCIGFRL